MAFTNFYQDSGGHDMNAGSVQNASASVTSTNGDWGNAAANRFTAASGTPFSAVTVGEWASIYVDGTTSGAVYVAQVTAVNASGASIDLSTTAKYGTAPSNSATGRSCKIGGSWLTELPLTTLTGTVPASTKINLKGNLTITASRTIALAGTTTAPLWFSGYNTTPGDLDSDTTNSLAKPVWTINATFAITASGAHQTWTGLSVVGNRSATIWNHTGGQNHLSRCRFENTSSNAAAIGLQLTGNQFHLSHSWVKTPATATTDGVLFCGGGGVAVGCVFEGGGLCGIEVGGQTVVLVDCVFLNNVVGVLASTGLVRMFHCTISNASSDGVKWTGTPPNGSTIMGCLFRSIGSNVGINNASGTNTNQVFRACNDFYSCTTPETGFGDSPALFQQTDSADPVVSATNLTTVATANARVKGFPGIFENQTFSGYADIGAVQSHPPPFGHPGLQ
jgi:hypothetical protein